MFASYISIALLAASSASGLVVPRAQAAPAGWWTTGLEDYTTYNARYNALGCAQQHNTKFFDACCHPLRKTQTLASRPAMCNPASKPTSVAASATPTPTDDGDDDCDDDGDDVPSTTSSALPTPTDDGDDGDCDDGDDEPSPSTTASSAAPTSTDNGDDDCEPCEEGDDDCVEVPDPASSTPAPASSTPSSASTSSSSVHTTASISTHSSVTSSTHLTPQATTTPVKTPTPVKPTSTSSTTKAASTAYTGDITKQTTGTVVGGHATFFYQGGQKGACEVLHTDDQLVAAIDYRRYGDTGKVSLLCGEKIRVTNKNNGKSVDVVIADACPSCGAQQDVDLSYAAFTAIAKEEEGYVPIEYTFIGKGQL